MELSKADKAALLASLERTSHAIEEMLTSGLTTASEATYQTLAVTCQEASRMKLLRLGSTLRSTHEEVQRYVKDDFRFSATRLMFFLNRSWLLCRGIHRAVSEGDAAGLEHLMWTSKAHPVQSLQVVCLGAVKKVAAGSFCAFEFRLRAIDDGRPLSWSTVFPLKPGVEIPAEGYLHLPQKQKFTANIFLEKKVLEISNAMQTEAADGLARLQLLDRSRIVAKEGFKNWASFLSWNPQRASARIAGHEVSPFDVDVELQEEVVLDGYGLGEPSDEPEQERQVFQLQHRGQQFDLTIAAGIEGEAARDRMTMLAKKKTRPPLYGLMHYAKGRKIVQPLTLFDTDGPHYLTISDKSVDRKALLSALTFT